MSAETVHVHSRNAESLSQISHVIVCGVTEAAIDTALTLRRLGEAVTLLADDVRAEPRQLLERAGVMIVLGPPTDANAMSAARAARARSMVIAVASDLGCVEVALAARVAYPHLPLVCYVNDSELGRRIERSLGVRRAVCVSTVEAVHLAGCALGADVVGAFALDDDLVLLRRTIGELHARNAMRVLMIEEPDGRCVIAPSGAMPVAPGSIITTISHQTRGIPHSRLHRAAEAVARALSILRTNTPAALGWTVAVLALLAVASVFIFMAGMNIPFADAAYLVSNTITTVGYGDITPFSSGNRMRMFGSFVPLLGPALLGTLLLIFARLVLRPQRQASPQRGHVVFIAPPALAASAASHLARVSIEAAVAVPPDPSAWAAGSDIDALLLDTNVRAASALVAATHDAVTNVTLGLAARELNPSIHIAVGTGEGAFPPRIAGDMRMSTPASAMAASISLAASAALVGGLRYAVTINDRVFSFFDGSPGGQWAGLRPSEVAGSYNFLTLFRRSTGGKWCSADHDAAFSENENVLVVAWRRLGPLNHGN